MRETAATATVATSGLLAAFADHHHLLGGQPAYRLQRLAAAQAFLDDHPDLDGWMTRPVDVRLVELKRWPFAWQLVAFGIVSGRVRADPEFLFAQHFGHSVTDGSRGCSPPTWAASATPPRGWVRPRRRWR